MMTNTLCNKCKIGEHDYCAEVLDDEITECGCTDYVCAQETEWHDEIEWDDA